MGVFIAHELGLELVRALGPVLPLIARKDKDLARQLRRSVASVVLNLAEGTHSDPGNREARYATAAGSAKETQSALLIAEAWGYIRAPEVMELSDRLTAITYRLAHGPARTGSHSSFNARHSDIANASSVHRPRPIGLGPADSALRPRPPGLGHSVSDSDPDSDSDPATD